MNTITVMAVAGLAAGSGLALIYSGFRPPRPALAHLLDSLARPAPAPVAARRRLDIALAAPLSRLGFPRQRTRQDLDILDRDKVLVAGIPRTPQQKSSGFGLPRAPRCRSRTKPGKQILRDVNRDRFSCRTPDQQVLCGDRFPHGHPLPPFIRQFRGRLLKV